MSHNYYNTFIAVADDTKAVSAVVPEPRRGKATVATMQYEMLSEPFRHTQEEVLFEVWLARQGESGQIEVAALSDGERGEIRTAFFAKGQACLRASPLTKTYGWGVLFDSDGRAALVPMDSEDYRIHLNDPELKVVKAMRSTRA